MTFIHFSRLARRLLSFVERMRTLTMRNQVFCLLALSVSANAYAQTSSSPGVLVNEATGVSSCSNRPLLHAQLVRIAERLAEHRATIQDIERRITGSRVLPGEIQDFQSAVREYHDIQGDYGRDLRRWQSSLSRLSDSQYQFLWHVSTTAVSLCGHSDYQNVDDLPAAVRAGVQVTRETATRLGNEISDLRSRTEQIETMITAALSASPSSDPRSVGSMTVYSDEVNVHEIASRPSVSGAAN